MKSLKTFLNDGNKVGKAAAVSTIIGIFFIWNVSGVLGSFWRTLDNLTSNGVSSPSSFQYWYGYGDAGFGYGYGYWYGYGAYASGYINQEHNVCDITSVANWSVGVYPACTITCNNNYTLSNNSCVYNWWGGGGWSSYVAPKTSTGVTATGITSTGVISTTDDKGYVTITTNAGKTVKLSDISTSFAKAYIERLVSAGIVNGYADGSFKPENKATRAEYLKMVLKAMGEDYSTVDTSTSAFTDVDKTSWQAKVIKKAAMLGIISTENKTFRPDASISRSESMKMLLKAAKIDSPEVTKSSFSDVSGWATKYVEKAKQLWIVAANATFRPTASITRAEVSKIVVKAMDMK